MTLAQSQKFAQLFIQIISYFSQQIQPKFTQKTRPKRTINQNQKSYAMNSDESQLSVEPQEAEQSQSKKQLISTYPDLDPRAQAQLTCGQDPIESLIWRRQNQYTNLIEYLVKFKWRSYQKCKWMSIAHILTIGTFNIHKRLRNFDQKFNSMILSGDYDALAIQNGQYHDPNFTEIDRILTCTQMFPIIHAKKASQMKGQWYQSLYLVVAKLLNFIKDGLNIGVSFLQFINSHEDEKFEFGNVMDLGVLCNKVFLGNYKEYDEFWNDLGRVWKSFARIYGIQKPYLIQTFASMKEASIFLYYQWYHLSQQRYHKMRKFIRKQKMFEISDSEYESDNNQKVEEPIQSQEKVRNTSYQRQNFLEQRMQIQEPNDLKIDLNPDSQSQLIDVDKYTKSNILLSDRKADPASHKQSLQKLNPSTYTYRWLIDNHLYPSQKPEDFLDYQYKYLNNEDMEQLDLNKEIDVLYLVKWKNLSYNDSTWEKGSQLDAEDVLSQFKNINKAMNKESRLEAEKDRKNHVRLLTEGKHLNYKISTALSRQLYFIGASKRDIIRYDSSNAPVFKSGKMLRSYQLDGLNWLIKSWHQDRNVILGDQMGLGKTIQTLAFLHHLLTYQSVKGPFLIIVPLTTIIQWKRAIQQWTNMNCVVYYDQKSNQGRKIIKNYQCYFLTITMQGNRLPSKCNKFKILLTTYETMKMEIIRTERGHEGATGILHQTPFQMIILDQAHRLKNRACQNLEAILKLPCKRKLLLTGTPIQNNTSQIWTLLNYIEPENFPSLKIFQQKYGDLTSQSQLRQFTTSLKPYLLRRMKQDVQKSIPPIQQIIIDVQLTDIQKRFYKGLYQKNRGKIISSLTKSNFNALQIQLRKCCNHPFLIHQAVQDQITEFCELEQQAIEKLVVSSGKMILLRKLLKKFKEQGKKVLLFSQFTSMLDLLERYLRYTGYVYERFDGSTKNSQRQDAIDRFNHADKKRDIFLISTKAGGVGINLTSATVIIIYDSDWNPQNDTQAIARAHRIGQTNQVIVYRLITSKTYEAEMFDRASKKLGLDKAVLYGGDFRNTSSTKHGVQGQADTNRMSKIELETLLKKGIVGLMGNDDKGEQFFQRNIDQILEKNTRLVKYGIGKNTGASFSKSRFVGDNTNCQLELNDPNFWAKALVNTYTQHTAQTLLAQFTSFKEQLTIQKQKQFMISAIKVIGIVIESKISLKNYSMDQELKLMKFLQEVVSRRQVHQHYKKLAERWQQDVERPPRHYQKPTKEDLDIPIQANKNIDKRKTKRYNEQIQESQEEQQYNSSATSKQKQKTPSPKTKPTKRLKKQTIKQTQEENSSSDNQAFKMEENSQEQNQKEEMTDNQAKQKVMIPCCYCEAPYCSSYCNGMCGRTFHQLCKEYIQNQEKQQPPSLSIQQLSAKVSIQQLTKSMNSCSYICKDCRLKQVQCQLCKCKGIYHPQQENTSLSQQSLQNQLLPCSKCDKFYHTKCIRKSQTVSPQLPFHFKKNKDKQTVIVCPQHYCAKCSKPGQSLNKCIRCPKAYHIGCSQKDKDIEETIKCFGKFFICGKHIPDQEEKMEKTKFYQSALIGKKKALVTKKKDKGSEKKAENKIANRRSKEKRSSRNHPTKKLTKETNIQSNDSKEICKSNNKQSKDSKKGDNFSYQHFGIAPPSQTDYSKEDIWCLYCGARYASSFIDTEKGEKTLCSNHQGQKKMIQQKMEKITRPLHPQENIELVYINDFSQQKKNNSPEDIIQALGIRKKVKTT